MNPLRAFSHDRQRLVALMLALVLLARLLVPAGWMPSAQEGRWISICSGSGEAMVWLDADGAAQPGDPDSEQHKDGSCTFGAVSFAFAVPDLTGALAAFAALSAVPVLRLVSVAIGRGLAAPPPPKTGPPLLN